MIEGIEQQIPYAEPVVWIVLEGTGVVDWRSGAKPLEFGPGSVVLLPAALNEARVRILSSAQWLEVTVPARSDLADFPRPSAKSLRDSPSGQNLLQIAPLRKPAQ
jgi:hypothetical protein